MRKLLHACKATTLSSLAVRWRNIGPRSIFLRPVNADDFFRIPRGLVLPNRTETKVTITAAMRQSRLSETVSDRAYPAVQPVWREAQRRPPVLSVGIMGARCLKRRMFSSERPCSDRFRARLDRAVHKNQKCLREISFHQQAVFH